MKRTESRRVRKESPKVPGRTVAALAVFALMAVAGPLLFGAVDRLVQVGLVALLALGVYLRPPAMLPLSPWGNRLAVALLALLVFKELAPADWFGATMWRTVATRDFGAALPFTHHPEPARALDGWIAAVIAGVWFFWVRRLAEDRESRILLAWTLFAAAVIVAAVSFATRGWDEQAIYGMRLTVGWRGFGPFPNRNHTGDFLAMGALLGAGCVGWAAARKKWRLLGGGLAGMGLVLAGLLATESRGGLLAFGLGLLVFLGLVQLRMRSRQAFAAALGVALVVGACALAFGGPVLARFSSEQAGLVSNALRVSIWRDVFTMWKDAPIFGHGINSFQQIFPFYQTLEFENGVVLHPESSWRQWLVELGLIPVVLGALALLVFASVHLRETIKGRGFFFRAAAFAAVAAILGHSIIDVPAHRWGTTGFALAALALACPMRVEGLRVFSTRKTALVPLAVAGFWTLPFFLDAPAWSPLTLNRTLARCVTTFDVSVDQLRALLRYFPLSSDLNQHLGVRELAVRGETDPGSWQRPFKLAARLLPGSWRLPEAQARAVMMVSPKDSLGFWVQAVDRGAGHRDEVLGLAFRATAGMTNGASFWGRYVESNPRLLLAYAEMVPEERGRYYRGCWWKTRALTAELDPAEVAALYRSAHRWMDREQLDAWMVRRSAWKAGEQWEWARLLHGWKEDSTAWQLIAAAAPEHPFPALQAGLTREGLEERWKLAPGNYVNAQQLAAMRARDGEVSGSEEVILAVGMKDGAPQWFVNRAAHMLARQERFGEAVALLLKAPPPRAGDGV
jgi:O-antigen ligase